MTSTIYVQFSDGTDETIVTVFGSPQDEASFPHYGVMPSDDPRYVTYYAAQYPQAQQFLIKPGS